jgi:hypothetical protein
MNEWISVKDRMPKKGEYKEILTFQMVKNIGTGKMMPHVSIDARDEMFIRKGRLYIDHCSEEITHWMPLPAPPK